MTEETDTKHEPLPTYTALMDMVRLREGQDRRAAEPPRLDYSKPPPGYTADGQWWSHPPDEPSKVVFLGGYVDARNVARVAPDDGALAAAWAHYKTHNDPPGYSIGLVMKGQGATAQGDFVVDCGVSQVAAVPAYKGKEQRAGAYQEARTVAWTAYDRLVPEARMSTFDDAATAYATAKTKATRGHCDWLVWLAAGKWHAARRSLDSLESAAAQRLDYSKPPPGYEVGHESPPYSEWFWMRGPCGAEGYRGDVAPTQPAALAAAWAHYKASSDPPGLSTVDDAMFGWRSPRAAAWAWYDRRLALHERLRSGLGDRLGRCDGLDFWPAILTWSNEQVSEVELWLVDSTAEMPEVLRG